MCGPEEKGKTGFVARYCRIRYVIHTFAVFQIRSQNRNIFVRVMVHIKRTQNDRLVGVVMGLLNLNLLVGCIFRVVRLARNSCNGSFVRGMDVFRNEFVAEANASAGGAVLVEEVDLLKR